MTPKTVRLIYRILVVLLSATPWAIIVPTEYSLYPQTKKIKFKVNGRRLHVWAKLSNHRIIRVYAYSLDNLYCYVERCYAERYPIN